MSNLSENRQSKFFGNSHYFTAWSPFVDLNRGFINFIYLFCFVWINQSGTSFHIFLHASIVGTFSQYFVVLEYAGMIYVGEYHACLQLHAMQLWSLNLSEPGFTKPVGTGPVWPAGSGFGRYPTGQNSKFKFKFKKWKISKKNPKILQGAMNLMVSNFLKNSFI